MDKPVTWKTDIKPMLAIGVVPDMTNIGYDLGSYDFVAQNYEILHNRMADGTMPPGVSKKHIKFIETWIDNDAPEPDFVKVQKILDAAVGGVTAIGVHGKFWRGLCRHDFVHQVLVKGMAPIVLKKGAASYLVRALKGEIPFGGPPGGFSRMPAGLWWTDEVRTKNVALFKQWKKDGFK